MPVTHRPLQFAGNGCAETFEIARALQPALIMLEDIDLVGGHRDGPWAAGGTTLNMLLNEMDGLAPARAMADMLGTGGRLGARMLGAESTMGFVDVS